MWRWIVYFFTAKRGGHGVHSPLVYKWQEHFKQSKAAIFPYVFSDQELDIEVPPSSFGAGSKKAQNQTLKNYFARIAWDRNQLGLLHSFLAAVPGSWKVLELGTGGGSCAFQLDKHPQVDSLTTVDADDRFWDIIQAKFSKKTTFVKSLFQPYLEKEAGHFSLIILDGDHVGERVLQYLDLILQQSKDRPVWLVLDDIRWTKDMFTAWESIINRPQISLSVDAGRVGYLYLGPRKQKEHFRVWVKPF
ncbi:MAG: hypothetical protein ACJAY8_000671 [Sphingobacteriales bacterium]|jgi:hypothetical protein